MSSSKIIPQSIISQKIQVIEYKYEYPSKKDMEARVIHSFGEGSLPVGPLFDTEDKYMKQLKFRYRRVMM